MPALKGDSTDAPINAEMALWAAVKLASGVSLTPQQLNLVLRSFEANRWALRFEAEEYFDLDAEERGESAPP